MFFPPRPTYYNAQGEVLTPEALKQGAEVAWTIWGKIKTYPDGSRELLTSGDVWEKIR
jgi:hypothetical protein